MIKIKDKFFRALKITISIASFLGLIFLMRWAGLKGILSFLVGMLVMAYLLLSNNLIMRSVITMFNAAENLKELKDEK